MAGPDLSAGKRAVEALMEDTCVIYPPFEPRDWVRDPTTLRLMPSAAAVPVYGSVAVPAKCKLKAGGAQAREEVIAGVARDSAPYRLDLPLDAPPLEAGAICVLMSSLRMPSAVGTALVIGDAVVKTLAVQASYAARREQRTED